MESLIWMGAGVVDIDGGGRYGIFFEMGRGYYSLYQLWYLIVTVF